EEPPKSYVVHNILGIIGCLSVLGIIGLVFGLQVSSKWRMGDYVGAHSNAHTAKILGIISMIGLVPAVLYVLFLLIRSLFAILRCSPHTGRAHPRAYPSAYAGNR